MLYFNPKPNFKLLSKYYQFSDPPELMVQQYPDGYPIVVDWYDTDEKVEGIIAGFAKIVNKYSLIEHADNLLFLCLGKIQEIEAIQYELDFQYAQKKRTKELAGLLLTFRENPINEFDGILFKTRKRGTTKVFDQSLTQWIGNTITEAIKEGRMPIANFEFNIREAFFDKTENGLQLNNEKLKAEAIKAIVSPTRKVKALHADFCFYLYSYLVNETNIKPNPNILFSDLQKLVYFDLLALFAYINPDTIESEPTDYISALLRNRINILNPHLQGNKTNKK